MSGPLPATNATFRRLLTAAPFTSSCSRYLSCEALNASTRSLRSAAWPSEFACANQKVTTLRPSCAQTGTRGRLAARAAAGRAATIWRRVTCMAALPLPRNNGIMIVDILLVIRITEGDEIVNTDTAKRRRQRAPKSAPDTKGHCAGCRRLAGGRVAGAQQVGNAVGSRCDPGAHSQARRRNGLSAASSGADAAPCPHHGTRLRRA